jgi:hypothetical protein
MMVSGGAPSTLIYPGYEKWKASSVFLNKCLGLGLHDKVYRALVKAYKQSKEACTLLKDYGQVLYACVESQDGRKHEKPSYPHPVQRGAVISIPGGLPHAGPCSGRTRAAIFFTGSPESVEPYDSDKQHSAVIVYVEVLRLLWPHLPKEDAKTSKEDAKMCRFILLGIIPQLVSNETRYRKYWSHFYYKKICKWLFEMENHTEKCMFGSWFYRIDKLADAEDLFSNPMTKDEAKAYYRTLEKR